jgi:PRC-barrel domain
MSDTPIGQDETPTLIGSDKVEGTSVYRSNGEKIGTIERLMLDKKHGCVAYAVMSFGGFMGIGHDHYPLPWSLLRYNPEFDGYEVNLSDRELNSAPKYGQHDTWDWGDRAGEKKVCDFYKVAPYTGPNFNAGSNKNS